MECTLKEGRYRELGRKRMWSSEGGFTLVELSITVVILGLLLTVATVAYANINYGVKLDSSKRQIEAALNRAKTAARQQNVTYRLIFYTEASSANANSYEFMRNEKSPDGTWAMTPVDESVTGEEVSKSGNHTYIKWARGVRLTGCSEISGSMIVIEFSPSGTAMVISGSNGAGGPASQVVTLNLASGKATGSVAINSLGEITKR